MGEPVSVTVQALNRTYEGKVARFDDKVNPETRTMETEVDVPNPTLELVPGMYAAASIAAEQIARRADCSSAGDRPHRRQDDGVGGRS